jgi:hypothetical protein
MKCHFCRKTIRFDDRVFYVDGEPHHITCVSKALARKKRNELKRKVEREQKKLGVYFLASG